MQDLTKAGRTGVGIVAGAGPDAGLTLWRKILAVNRRRRGDAYRGDLDAPRVRVVSEPLLGHVAQMDEYREVLGSALRGALTELDAGSDRIVIACHALQAMATEIAAAAGIGEKIVSLPAIVRDHVSRLGLGAVGLLGAPSVTADPARSPYSALWGAAAVEVPARPGEVLDLILQAKRIGPAHLEIQERLAQTVSSFRADAVLLACTDFSDTPLPAAGKQVIDILDIAAERVIDAASP